jgi:hypothetical protein
VAYTSDDDGMLWWLSNRSQAAANFARHYLLTHTAVGYNIHGKRVTVPASGLTTVYAGAASAAYFGVPNRVTPGARSSSGSCSTAWSTRRARHRSAWRR